MASVFILLVLIILQYDCCGVDGAYNWPQDGIPISCCHIDIGVVGTFNCTGVNANNLGCANALGDWLGYNAHVVAVTSLVATCLQVPSSVYIYNRRQTRAF